MKSDFFSKSFNKLLFLTFMLALVTSISFADRKTTDLMSKALKARSAGKLGLAVKYLNKAVSVSSSKSQTVLALFMLGDCQLERHRYTNARKTFKRILSKKVNKDDRAEAMFGLAQAEANIGNVSRAKRICKNIIKKYRKSPYAELAKSFYISKKYESQQKAQNKNKPRNIKQVEKTVYSKLKKAKKPRTKATYAAHHKSKAVKVAKKSKPVSTRKKPMSHASTTVSRKVTRKQKLDATTSRVLNELLNIPQATAEQKEALASQILGDQELLKNGISASSIDKVLFRLASNTAFFGEYLEACKTYDQILTKHPTSRYVESAYFEAIRLRAILKIYDSVISWSKAFLAAFPTSSYRTKVMALVRYAELRGNVSLTLNSKSSHIPRRSKNTKTQSAASKTVSVQLKSDPLYKQAIRNMKNDNYQLALRDFIKLKSKYPHAPDVYWNISLIQVQLENFPAADVSVKRMLQLSPDNKDAKSLLGYINYRLKKFRKAAEAYRGAADKDKKGVDFFDAGKAAERMNKSANGI